MTTTHDGRTRAKTTTGAETPRKPPKFLFKYLVNPLMTAILRSPLHGKLSEVLLLITFTGRKTGKRYTTPVSYQREGDTLILLTYSPWWRNFQGGAPVVVRVQGQERQCWAEATQDPSEVVSRAKELVRKRGVQGARQIGLDLDPSREPTDKELRRAIRGLAAICIEPDRSRRSTEA